MSNDTAQAHQPGYHAQLPQGSLLLNGGLAPTCPPQKSTFPLCNLPRIINADAMSRAGHHESGMSETEAAQGSITRINTLNQLMQEC